ncbi:MAG TPA: VWA domain-containing protein [Acidobacteriaceae bacterium]|jgi:VWFA-related protein|nr:VWA domain-containing protein [Acidobacteriaceae bacterium]
MHQRCVSCTLFLLPLAALIAGNPAAQAQRGHGSMVAHPTDNKPYTIPVTVRRVVLDVVVTDSKNNAVHGLTAHDFSIREDDKQQGIKSFEEFNFEPPANFVAPKLPSLPPNTYVNVQQTPEVGPLNVIVYDAVHMAHNDVEDDQIRARRQLADFLASKPAGTRFCLFLLARDFHLVQGFTTDPNQLLQAFDTHRKDGAIPLNFLMSANYGAADTDLPYEVMAFVGHYLEGLPGRKNLIWLSSEFPTTVPMFAVQATIATATGTGGQMAPASNAPMQAQGFSGTAPTTMGNTWDQEIMRKAIDALNAAQVSVYPVDVGGLKPEMDGIDTAADHIAAVTGGHAYFNTNDFAGAMKDATINGSSYYEITYAPSNARMDAKVRNIRVNLDRSGYHLAYRQYYYAEDPDAPMTNAEKRTAAAVALDNHPVAHLPGDSLFAYMEHGAPIDHDIVFRAQFHADPAKMATPEQMANLIEQPAYFVVRKSNKPVKMPPPIPLQAYTIDYVVLDHAAQTHGNQVLEFAACAYDSLGHMLNGISQNAARVPAQGATPAQQALFRAQQTFDVPTTAAWLRVAVRDVHTDRIGTMEIPLPLGTSREGGGMVQSAGK